MSLNTQISLEQVEVFTQMKLNIFLFISVVQHSASSFKFLS